MADFKETLKVAKNSNCFYTWSITQVNLADLSVMRVSEGHNATLPQVATIIEDFIPREAEVNQAISELLDYGKIKFTDEY